MTPYVIDPMIVFLIVNVYRFHHPSVNEHTNCESNNFTVHRNVLYKN